MLSVVAVAGGIIAAIGLGIRIIAHRAASSVDRRHSETQKVGEGYADCNETRGETQVYMNLYRRRTAGPFLPAPDPSLATCFAVL